MTFIISFTTSYRLPCWIVALRHYITWLSPRVRRFFLWSKKTWSAPVGAGVALRSAPQLWRKSLEQRAYDMFKYSQPHFWSLKTDKKANVSGGTYSIQNIIFCIVLARHSMSNCYFENPARSTQPSPEAPFWDSLLVHYFRTWLFTHIFLRTLLVVVIVAKMS